MKKKWQILGFGAALLVMCGMIAASSQLNAQQASSAPVVIAQAQEPQSGQQPAQAPGQESPAQQPAQTSGQGGTGQQTPGQAAPPDQQTQSSGQATQPDQQTQPGPATQPDQHQPAQQAPASAAGPQPGVQTFTGMIVKSGDKFVLQDQATGNTYDIDHQDIVGQHVGRRVRVTGTLDASGKMIHLQQPSGQ